MWRRRRYRSKGPPSQEERSLDTCFHRPVRFQLSLAIACSSHIILYVISSNILIGLLSHLRRPTPHRKRIYITRRKPVPTAVSTMTTQDKVDPVAAVAAVKTISSRPLAMLPTITDHSSSSATRDYPIPLPSFATLPRSLPSAPFLSSLRRTDDALSSEEFERQIISNSDGCDGSGIEGGHGSGGNGGLGLTWQKEKKASKHLWHAALILILERGRPITRVLPLRILKDRV
jgi:hypothetical protein